MGMRATRMLSLLTYLQVRGQLSASELAERLEVSERTVQRDIVALAATGVPVRSVRGPGGGYRLEGRYQTRLTGVAAGEAQALAFLGLATAAVDLGLDSQLDAARNKVWASLTGEARRSAEHTAQRFHLDAVRWYGTSEPVPLLGRVAEALWRDRQARAAYLRDGRSAELVLEPLGLVLAAGEWYLVAAREAAVRTYRVSRFQQFDVLDEAVVRPVGFDLAQYWAGSRRELEGRYPTFDVTLRVAGPALPRLRRLVAVRGQANVPVNETSPWVEITVPFEGEGWALTALLGLGSQAEVLSPPSLRRRMALESVAMAKFYADEGPGRPEEPLFVVVSGPPASGKSTLAPEIARRLGLPLVAKDILKDALISVLDVPTVEASRTVGTAAVAAMLAVAAHAPQGAVLESNFYRSVAADRLRALPGRIIEVFCQCDREVAGERYRRRARRHPREGHFDALRTPEELCNDELSEPVAGGWPVICAHTNEPVDVGALIAQVRAAAAGSSS